VAVLDPVAVARSAPGDIGQDQRNPVAVTPGDPHGGPGGALDGDRELDLDVRALVATEAREVARGQIEAEIAYDCGLLAPARIQRPVVAEDRMLASLDGDFGGRVATGSAQAVALSLLGPEGIARGCGHDDRSDENGSRDSGASHHLRARNRIHPV